MEDYVVIPTYNERGNIPKMLDKVTLFYPDLRVMVVDDNSPDGTADIIRSYAARFPLVELHSRPGKLGLGSAYIQAFQKILARSPHVRSIITMDADFSHDPDTIKDMRRLISEFDLIIGSRYTRGGSVVYWPLWRRILSRLGNFYARTVTGTPIRDMTAGFHCFSGKLLRRYDLARITSTGFAFLMEMKIIAYRMGARIKEVPIACEDRKEGKSKLSNRIIYEGLIMPWRFSRLLGVGDRNR